MKLPRVVIIGGGGTGAAILYDLAQRGFPVTLFEKGELTSGTTGRHHGQLHSGARYAVRDRAIARECMVESSILRRIAPNAIEMNYGMFVALDEQDEIDYLPAFREACDEAGIPTRRVDGANARKYEPQLSESVRCAVLVPDGTIDAFRLPMHFFAAAASLGAMANRYCEVVDVERGSGAVTGVRVHSLADGREFIEPADIVINATGAWAGHLAARADVTLDVTPAPGTLVAVRGRLVNMVISHLRPPASGDIIVPQRNLSIVGTTEWVTGDPDHSAARIGDIDWLRKQAAAMVPVFADAPLHAAWSAPRPLAGKMASGAQHDTRSLSRDFICTDHPGLAGFFSVVGGKATVMRAMAERTVDLACRFACVNIPCTTASKPLAHYRDYYRTAGRPVAMGAK